MKTLYTVLSFAAVMALAACKGGESKPETSSSNAPAPAALASLPSTLFVKEAIPGAKSILEIRATAAKGDEIVLTGYIGGRVEPFTAGRATFLMVDPAEAIFCTRTAMDTCPTPWDACCTPPDAIAAASASVQVVDTKGQLLRADLNGVNGLAPGTILTVAGKVSQKDNVVLVVDASGIFVDAKAVH